MDRVAVANDLSFRVGLTGHSAHLSIEPLPPVQSHNPLHDLPQFILPPAFPEETTESIKEYIEEKYLTPRLDPDEFSPEKAGRDWDFDWFSKAKIPVEPSLPRTAVIPEWELPFRRQKGQEKGIWEPQSVQVEISELNAGVEDSSALPRITGPAKDFVRGSLHSRPFHPGGLDGSQSLPRVVPEGSLNGDWIREVLEGGPAEKIPPSFKQGLDSGDLKAYPSSWSVNECHASPKVVSDEKQSKLSLQFDDMFKRAWEDDFAEKEESDGIESEAESNESEIQVDKTEHEDDVPDVKLSELDQILSVDSAVLDTKADVKNEEGDNQGKESWAIRESNNGIADRFHELVPDMALEFPFELDRFQKEAIYYLERGESVFVAAHTSAGKTVVAEYAFALASKHCTRAVYTAPIKTISNQKYRDFTGKFDVGLLTGDISLRPEASCLIMTTEILRSMLYRGADIIRDIEWVIFDEVHYVNDAERGVVWEEVIIMLPRHINFVLLSATVPNTIEFADWIGRTKQKIIRVTGTTKRPVPLEHCLFYSGELYRICENEKILEQGLKAAKDAYKKKNSNAARSGPTMHSGSAAGSGAANAQNRDNSHRGKQKHSGSRNSGNFNGTGSGNFTSGSQPNLSLRRPDASLWLQLVNKLLKKSLLPVIIFCFSKNRCDRSADSMMSIDLTSSLEKSEIRVFCDKAFSRLKGSDRNLPQILRVQSLLRRGIGVHHAGLLPIVKEVIEMLFCRGVIKVLFSTETFAMGVNAPARTVVFDTLRKFDGKEYRQIIPGEYTQMAGRAGRRGLDKFGTVIIMCRDEILEERDLRHIIVGHPTKLESQFRLTYIMILQLLRVEELKIEDMLKRSFAEFHTQKKLPEKQQLLMLKLSQPAKTIECIKGEPSIEDYYKMYTEAEGYLNQITEGVMQSHTAQQFLVPGRVVVVKSQTSQDHLLGVVVKAPSASLKKYIVLVLKPDLPPTMQPPTGSGAVLDIGSNKSGEGFFVLPKGKRGLDDEYCSSVTARKGTGVINIKLPYQGVAAGVNYEVREVDNKEFLCICNCKLKIDQVRLLEDVSSAAYSKTVQQLSEKKPSGSKYPPALDPKKDLKLKDMELVEAYHKWDKLLQNMTENKCHGCIKLDEHMKLVKVIFKYRDEVNELTFQMSDKALQQMPDFHGRINVLKEIGCIDDDLVVQIKGRVACEMNSGEELICTECLFENQLENLEPEEAVAVMSAFVFQQKNTSEPSLTPKLSAAVQRLYDTAIRLGQLQASFQLPVDPEEYARENLKFGLVEVVYEWAKGTEFADICELTDVPEGLIVRTIVRLDETCREFRNAAAIMGNSALYKKMESASNAIKRDIVFAASLYITGI
ncbi:DExH-box ATP-dependent RNA helicase DExH11-like [Chenopodium quinoa]|uniref:DExH-box ATP-dependent RNA helicase DExH11 n=1 Tax=Chenopodium quinoa TaxID=63459 RepID=A0A803KRP6_CHEQI|nr:DExH-box ATP-dependent RNA helicase DExH11-like [Chenopodium quinoa]